LAARALPGVAVSPFLNGLVGQLGWPLTEEKLSRMTVSQLKKALAGDGGVFEEGGDATTLENVIERIGLTRLKEVVEILWGRTAAEEVLPHLEAYADGDMPHQRGDLPAQICRGEAGARVPRRTAQEDGLVAAAVACQGNEDSRRGSHSFPYRGGQHMTREQIEGVASVALYVELNDETLTRLSTLVPGIHLTLRSDDVQGAAPALHYRGLNAYLVDGHHHCLTLNEDLSAATELVLVETPL
jgi:hypothetical protein